MDLKDAPTNEIVCPFLGLYNDTETRFDFPNPGNHCHREKTPRAIQPDYQYSVCLNSGHLKCPIYLKKGVAADRLLPRPVSQPAQRSAGGLTSFRLLIGLMLVVGSLAGMFLLSQGLLNGGWFGGQGSPVPPTQSLNVPINPTSVTATETPTPSLTPDSSVTPAPSLTPLPSPTASATGTATGTATTTLTPTATPTTTPIPIFPPPTTWTPVPPTSTLPVPPTNTPVQPSNTPFPPTNTPISDVPTNTPTP